MKKKRTKRYRPRPIGAPLGRAMRDELILPAYSSLTVLQQVNDIDAQESAWHTLTALFNYIYVARTLNSADSQPVQDGLSTMKLIRTRFNQTGVIRATGPELTTIKHGVSWCDDILGTLRTDLIQRAVLQVDQYLQEHGETA